MGRLGCKCGIVLSNVDCPNDVDLWGFEGSIIERLLLDHPQIVLTDVVMDHSLSDVYFWYCKDCGRVYVFRNNHQMCNRVYHIQEYDDNEPLDIILKMRDLYFYTDKEVEEPTEKDFDYSLKDFFDNLPHPYRYYITDDLTKVYAYDMKKHSIAHCYVLEATYNDEPDTSETLD